MCSRKCTSLNIENFVQRADTHHHFLYFIFVLSNDEKMRKSEHCTRIMCHFLRFITLCLELCLMLYLTLFSQLNQWSDSFRHSLIIETYFQMFCLFLFFYRRQGYVEQKAWVLNKYKRVCSSDINKREDRVSNNKKLFIF